MKLSAIKKIRDLHNKVVHAPSHKREDECYSDVEFLKEDKVIKKIKSQSLLQLVCPKCFPLNSLLFKLPLRPSEMYALDYPKVTEIRQG